MCSEYNKLSFGNLYLSSFEVAPEGEKSPNYHDLSNCNCTSVRVGTMKRREKIGMIVARKVKKRLMLKQQNSGNWELKLTSISAAYLQS